MVWIVGGVGPNVSIRHGYFLLCRLWRKVGTVATHRALCSVVGTEYDLSLSHMMHTSGLGKSTFEYRTQHPPMQLRAYFDTSDGWVGILPHR